MAIIAGEIRHAGPVISATIAARTAGSEQISVSALIDTGANYTALDPTLIERLALTSTGSILMSREGRDVRCPQFDIALTLARHDVRFALTAIEWHFFQEPNKYQVLLGRDVLAHCTFVYLGNMEKFTLCF